MNLDGHFLESITLEAIAIRLEAIAMSNSKKYVYCVCFYITLTFSKRLFPVQENPAVWRGMLLHIDSTRD